MSDPFRIYLVIVLLTNCSGTDFKLTIIHTNDIHANFEGVPTKSGTYGGIGRVITFIENERDVHMGADEGLIYLDAGDMFTGSDWFAFNRTDIASDFMNILHPDAMCLGNHEFDLGLSGLKDYILKLNRQVLCCNLDMSREPSFKDKIIPSTVLTVKNRRIGIVAYLDKFSRTTDKFWGNMNVVPETIPIEKEIEKFKRQKVNIIILLTHGGYKHDQKIAEASTDIDLIVDGHSHTFLYSGDDPEVKQENQVLGNYPTIVKNRDGKNVYIVQAFFSAIYVGKFIVTFDSQGEIIKTQGQPHFMNKHIRFSKKAEKVLDKYRPYVEKKRTEVIGKSKIILKGGRPCRRDECNLGNLILDSYVFHAARHSATKNFWTNTSIGIMNSGNMRQGIIPHHRTKIITFAQIMAVLPFFNVLVTMTITGKVLMQALEHSISWKNVSHKGEFLQMSGIHVVYDFEKPMGQRVVSVKVLCARCEIPYFEPLQLDAKYNVITTDFISGGGSGFKMFRKASNDKGIDQTIDVDAVKDYLIYHRVVDPEVEERIIVLNDNRPDMYDEGGGDILNGHVVLILIFFFVAILK